MATGMTAEGTTWRTRAMTPAVEAEYKCRHHGGVMACEHEDSLFLCKAHEGGKADCVGAPGNRHETFGPREVAFIGAGGKPYSPATPKGALRPAIPASIGEYLDTFALARRRLDGLEAWPVETFTAPRLSKIGKALTDARITRAYRELIAALVASGATPAYPIAARPRTKSVHPPRGQRAQHPKRKHEATRDHGAAARKAWATRHARNDNGSASALKAWATRRKAVAA